MAVRIRLSSLAMILAILMVAIPAAAQERTDGGGDDRKPPAAPPAAPAKPSVRADDCNKLPGGNAPINRLARLDGGISVRNLDLTYFGKPLFELTDQDYEYLTALWPLCSTFDEETAPKVAEKLKELVDDAKAVRQDSLEWIKQTEREAKALKPNQDGIEKIHDLWQQMLNREFEMLQSDMSYIAGVIEKRRDELYTAPQAQQRTLISPFDPGPAETRPLGNRGG
ncbi:MAG: hypothetical protein RLO51_21190 [Thalassobaculum sp.]|uniref:hypothetical protein n=1 Tax=Thalassobaculum sp. TaxID=2022740 RepID=UPI0032EC3382